MKRSRPSSAAPPPDFKRLKAKVGKRAIKPANVTDTTFRASTVQVRTQNVAADKQAASSSSGGVHSASAPTSASLDLVSSRGKSLPHLLLQLHHHAPNVRSSALHGIRDSIGPSRATSGAVRANLPSLVPALGRCLVDDDGTVRTVALAVVREVAKRVGEEDDNGVGGGVGGDGGGGGGVQSLQPFVPLTVAYVTSALNSLDDNVRLDGAEAVGVLCSASVFGPSAMSEHCDKILPAFVGLLDDLAKAAGRGGDGVGGESSQQKKKKKKRKGKGGVDERDDQGGSGGGGVGSNAVVRSLVALLRAASSSSSAANAHGPDDGVGIGSGGAQNASAANVASSMSHPLVPSLAPHDLTFVPGGVAINSLLVLRGRRGATVPPPSSSSLLSSLAASNAGASSLPGADSSSSLHVSSKDRRRRGLVAIATQEELLRRLRDRYVELTQRGTVHGSGNGLFLSHRYVEDLTMLVVSIRLLWDTHCRIALSGSLSMQVLHVHVGGNNQSGIDRDRDVKKLRTTARAVHHLMLESFPVRDDGRGRSEAHRQSYELVNASLCSALGEVGGVLDLSSTSAAAAAAAAATRDGGDGGGYGQAEGGGSEVTRGKTLWVDAVFAYILPRLERAGGGGDENDDEDGTTPSAAAVEGIVGPPPSLSSEEGSANVTLLKVIGQLLLRQEAPLSSSSRGESSSQAYLLDDGEKRMALLTKFGEAFFPTAAASEAAAGGESTVLESDAGATTITKSNSGVVDSKLCTSPTGRKAAMLLASLILQQQVYLDRPSDETEGLDSKVWSLVGTMAQQLPTYLQSWGGNYPEETAVVVAVLISVVRRYRIGESITCEGSVIEVFDDEMACNDVVVGDLVRSLRINVGFMFAYPKKKKKSRSKSGRAGGLEKVSIFEQLPSHSQRILMGLLGLLQFPSNGVMIALGQICSQSASASVDGDAGAHCVSNEMVDYIMDVMHSIRRTTPMQAYLSFLISSCGIRAGKGARSSKGTDRKEGNSSPSPEETKDGGDYAPGKNVTFKTIKPERVFEFDLAIERMCRALVRCGGMKTLPMICPVLMSWLGARRCKDNPDEEPRGFDPTHHLLQIRAALSILSCFALDEAAKMQTLTETADGRSARSIYTASPDIKKSLSDALCNVLVSLPLSQKKHDNEDEAKEQSVRLLAPAVALFSKQPAVLESALECILERISDTKTTSLGEGGIEGIIRGLLICLKCRCLAGVIRSKQISGPLEKVALTLENKVANGPLDSLGGALRTEVQLFIGHTLGEEGH